LAIAKKRLIFDEFFTFALGLGLSGAKGQERPAVPCTETDVRPLLSLLPYALTGAQKRTFEAIASDLKSGDLMNRLIVGDVGSGKTVCAAYAVYLIVVDPEAAGFECAGTSLFDPGNGTAGQVFMQMLCIVSHQVDPPVSFSWRKIRERVLNVFIMIGRLGVFCKQRMLYEPPTSQRDCIMRTNRRHFINLSRVRLLRSFLHPCFYCAPGYGMM
jgi:hypothetical protein